MTASVDGYKKVARIASRLRAGWPSNLVHVAIRVLCNMSAPPVERIKSCIQWLLWVLYLGGGWRGLGVPRFFKNLGAQRSRHQKGSSAWKLLLRAHKYEVPPIRILVVPPTWYPGFASPRLSVGTKHADIPVEGDLSIACRCKNCYEGKL